MISWSYCNPLGKTASAKWAAWDPGKEAWIIFRRCVPSPPSSFRTSPKWRQKGSKHVRGGLPRWQQSMNLQSWWIRKDQSPSKAQTNFWIMVAIIVPLGRLLQQSFNFGTKNDRKLCPREGLDLLLGFYGPSTPPFWYLPPWISLLWLRMGVFGSLRWWLPLQI